MNSKKENNPKVSDKSWKDNKAFTDNIGQFKDKQPSKEKKMEGIKKWQALNSLKKDIFKETTKYDMPSKMVKAINDKLEAGEVKEAIDLYKLIIPKEMDVTSKGEAITMDNITVNGKKQIIKMGD